MESKKTLTKSLLEMYHLLHRYHMMWYGKNFGGLDPWQGQGRILSALRRMHSITQKELGFILDLRPQSLGELLQKLEMNGYIIRYRSKEDKRAMVVELTEKGETFQVQKPDYDELFIELSRQERKELQAALDKISVQLRDWINNELEDSDYYEGQNYPTFRL
ncbi:MAG: MarR family transcriptional regulator [Selenomonadaceae bacterium]|nr:MarR family transcriptional regulator [Selenomonadaceae bacterium]